MKGKGSFSRNLSRGVLLLTAVLFVVVITVAAVYSHIIVAGEAKKSMEYLVDASVKDIEKTLQKVEFSIEASSWLVGENRDDDDYLYHITRMIVSENDNIVGSAIAFADSCSKGRHFFSPYSYIDPVTGRTESKQLGTDQYDYFGMEWFARPFAEGRPCWSEPYFDEGGGGYMMSTYSFPIPDSEGRIYAIITADVTLDWIDRVVDSIRPYSGSSGIMLSPGGKCLGYSGTELSIGMPLDSLIVRGNVGSRTIDRPEGRKGIMRYMVGGKMYFAVYSALENGWTLAVSCSYDDILSPASRLHMVLLLIGILGLLALYFICRHAVGRMTRPLLDFCSATGEIASGDFDVQLPEITTDDEIGMLHDSFANMQDSLKSYIANLQETTARNERFQSELSIASRIQQAMLSRDFPSDGRVDLHATVRSAKEVGGDLYDFCIRGNDLYFAIADVSGKGMPAAMFMAITKSAFRFISGMGIPLSEVMFKINNAVSSDNSYNMFVTMFIGRIDLETGRMVYCNAGHNPPLLGGTFLPVVPNIVVGAIPGYKYVEQEVLLGKGARLVLYTDGVTEAERADKEQFGEERLQAWAGSSDGTAAGACSDLMEKVRAFAGDNEQNDDITIMTIDIK